MVHIITGKNEKVTDYKNYGNLASNHGLFFNHRIVADHY